MATLTLTGASYDRRTTLAARDRAEQRAIGALVILACGYNGLLAVVNAHVVRLSSSSAAAAEIAILGAGVLVSLRRLTMADAAIVGFLYLSLVLAMWISLLNGTIYVDGVRNMAIVGVFTLLGTRVDDAVAGRSIAILAGIVLFFLMLEILSLQTYVNIFRPSDYLESTRGMRNSAFNESGLFNNALGFNGRFSFGLLDVPRTSSIFIEQVSLSNFAAVCALTLFGAWPLLRRWQRILLFVLPVLILASNNGRAASTLCAIFLVGYFVFPWLPRWSNLLVLPTVIAASLAIYPFATEREDNLVFRVYWGMNNVYKMDFGEYFGTGAQTAWKYFDGGYAFLIASTTMVGAVALIVFTLTRVPPCGSIGRRFALGGPIYLFVSLVVSGSSMFSIKTAALFWFLAGWLGSVAARTRKDLPGPLPA